MRVLKGAAIGVGLVIGACVAIPMAAVFGFAYLSFPLNLFRVTREFRIPSSSMEPTLHCARPAAGCDARWDDRVVIVKYLFFSPGRGDIVVFNTPRETVAACGTEGIFVKRIVGMPGDIWQERRGYVYINGKKLNEPYVKPDRRDTMTYAAVEIPKGQYFMMGDNRAGSCDSRRWGFLPRGNIIGKMIATYWPPTRISIQ